MELDPCNYCSFVGENKSQTSTHIHTKHPGMNCTNYHCWTCGITLKKEAGLKRHVTVKHLLEVKRFKESTEQMVSTLWDITPNNERYLTFIDYINAEQKQPGPERYFKIVTKINTSDKTIKIPLEKNGETSDPRPGIGIYKKMKFMKFIPRNIQEKYTKSSYPAPDVPGTLPSSSKRKTIC